MRGNVDPRKLGFLRRLVKVLEVCNDLWTGDGTLSSPRVELAHYAIFFLLFSLPCFLFLSFLTFLAFLLFFFSFLSIFFFIFFLLFRFLLFSFLSFIFFSFLCFFFPIDLRLSCVCVVIYTTCNIYVVVFLGWQAVYSVSPGVSNETFAPVWT